MKIYRQTTGNTCGPSCLLMILNHYYPRKFKLKRENELVFWTQAIIPPHNYTSAYALAKMATNNNIKVNIYEGGKFTYWFAKKQGYSKMDIRDMKAVGKIYRKEAKEAGVKIHSGRSDFERLKEISRRNDFIIPLVDSGVLNGRKAGGLHFVVISEFRKNGVLVFDPHSGKRMLKEAVLRKAFNNVKNVFKDPFFFMSFKR